jgi:NAD(P)-dependent dehydrogenase (short-subunit alcohol dehydrogenase family)
MDDIGRRWYPTTLGCHVFPYTGRMSVLAGKVLVVTGVAKGCGKVLAESFASEGATVVGCDVDTDGLASTDEAIRNSGGTADLSVADVSDPEAMRSLVRRAVEQHGGLDGAVNNAGIETTGAVENADLAAFDRLLDVNLKGVLHCMQAEIPAMRDRGGGAIVNMSSVTSDITAVAANGPYAATKGGVDALTKAAAVEVAKDNISVNALAFTSIDIPGDMIWRFLDDQQIEPSALLASFPIGRMGRPEELVAAVRYLLSDDARFVTGTTLVLDGGFTAQ